MCSSRVYFVYCQPNAHETATSLSYFYLYNSDSQGLTGATSEQMRDASSRWVSPGFIVFRPIPLPLPLVSRRWIVLSFAQN